MKSLVGNLKPYFLLALYIFILPFSQVTFPSNFSRQNSTLSYKGFSFKIRKRRNDSVACENSDERIVVEKVESSGELSGTNRNLIRAYPGRFFFPGKRFAFSKVCPVIADAAPPIYLRLHSLII